MSLLGKFTNIFKGSRPRLAGIGLDGSPYPLIQSYTEKGFMPNLAAILKRGSFLQMESSIPEISSVAWSSFITATNPAEHGIYGFMDLKPGSYQFYFPNYKDIKAKTLWAGFAEKNKSSVVLNIPSTYPARPVKGVLTAGFVAIDLEKATTPPAAYQYLKSIGYQTDINVGKARKDTGYLLESIHDNLQKRITAFDHFWEKEDWDFFIGVITETDRLHHFLWPAAEDENHKYHSDFVDFYKKVDQYIGKVYDRLEEDTTFFALSDHGFCNITTEVYLNRWLEENGYLSFSKDAPDSLADITPDTKAFAVDPSRIYINYKGKYPKGAVEQKDAEGLKTQIKEKLLKLTYNKNGVEEKVFKRAFFKEQIYSGPYLDAAPDLVMISYHGYDLKGSIMKKELFGRSEGLHGMHTQDEAFFFINRPQIEIKTISEAGKLLSQIMA